MSLTSGFDILDDTQMAATRGPLVIGMKGKDGCLIAAEVKDYHPVLSHSNVHTLVEAITGHTAATFSGLESDFRHVISFARKQAQSYINQFRKRAPVMNVAKEIQEHIHQYTLEKSSRPLVCYTLLTGWDEECKPFLIEISPTGKTSSYNMVVYGDKADEATKFLLNKYNPKLSLNDLVHVFKETVLYVFKSANVKMEIATCDDSGYKKFENIVDA